MDIENKYGTLAVQKNLLELIKKFDTFCNKMGINYSLNDGSLLGAIRHNGFIPWDDDLDVIVDRDNYFKLMHIPDMENYGLSVKRELWIDRIQLVTKESSLPVSDFVPTLDLMILDKAPTSLFHRKIKNIALGFVQGMIKSRPNYSRFNLKNKFISFVSYQMGKLLSDYYKINLYHKIAKNYGDNCSPYSSCYFEPYNDIGIIHRADALHKIERHQFEDTQVSILSCWDEYLKELYGDYMTPPKETERIPIHIK